MKPMYRSALLLWTALLPGVELVDDPIYRRMAAALAAKTDRTLQDDFRLAEIFCDGRQYDKGEALYRTYLIVAERVPMIYANLSVAAGKQARYAEAIDWADRAISAGQRLRSAAPDARVDIMHPTLVKASWLWESGRQEEAMALFTGIAIPPAGDPGESTYWGCRACFYASVGDQAELATAIGRCLDLADPHFVTFIRRDVVFDRYRSQSWFIEMIGVTLKP